MSTFDVAELELARLGTASDAIIDRCTDEVAQQRLKPRELSWRRE